MIISNEDHSLWIAADLVLQYLPLGALRDHIHLCLHDIQLPIATYNDPIAEWYFMVRSHFHYEAFR
jgi:hypothetical protein